MRRPGIIFFIVVIIFTIIKGNTDNVEESYVHRTHGIVKSVEEKQRRMHYYIDDILLSVKKKENMIYRPGDIVEFKGKSKDMSNMFIDGFDYGRYLKSKGVKNYIEGDILKRDGRNIYIYKIGRFREKIREINRFLYKENSDFLNASVIGMKTDLEKTTRDIFADTGTSHILAVSGLHISILIAAMSIAVSRVNSIGKFVAACIILTIYIELSGNSISVKRAVIFSIAGFLCFFIYRKSDTVNILFIMAAIFILENKYIVYNPSFLLSFLAVLSITVFDKHIRKKVYFSFISVTLSSQILTLPVVIFFFKEFSTISVIGNFIAVTPLSMVLIIDLASVLMYGINLRVALFLAEVNSIIIDCIFDILEKISGYGSRSIVIENVGISAIVTYYAVIAMLIIYMEYRSIKNNRFDIDIEK